MQPLHAREPRAVCARCRRPASVCWCAHVTPIDTATRVVILQHPRERDVPIGTARMASSCLTRSEIHVGVKWEGSTALARALSDPERPPVLLYPGDGAIDVTRDPPRGPVTLVVIDGTWWQAKKVVRENPALAKLPRYAFTPSAPSEYRIRREPKAEYVSTIEALALVLGALEGDPERFRAMLAPFRAMVDMQIEHAERLHGGRVRHARVRKPKRPPPLPDVLRDRADDVVCVVGEASSVPYRLRVRGETYEDELVCWAARRLSTGESFAMVASPSRIAARTPEFTGLSEAELARGVAPTELLERWRAFARDTDVICSWGRYATSLFAASGGWLPPTRVDLRQVARTVARGKVGTLEAHAERVGVSKPESAWAPGRAGARLGLVVGVAGRLVAEARARGVQ